MSLQHWIWLTQVVPDPAQAIRLLEVFSKPERIYSAELAELMQSEILTPDQCMKLTSSRSLTSALKIIQTCVEQNIRIISYADAVYPECLRAIPDPPLLLYVRGSFPLFDETYTLSVVGTRRAALDSVAIAEKFSFELASSGFYIISGMAAGIDSAANVGALSAGYQTAAVLGCGVDICYPAENRGLFERIAEHGCLISEYPPGTRPDARHFPRRNRIIAGLSNASLIISAPLYSGSLITAHLACEYGRELFVIPGSIQDPNFAGSNQLLSEGAVPVTSPQELLRIFRSRISASSPAETLRKKEAAFPKPKPSPSKPEPSDKSASGKIYPEYQREKLREILAKSLLPLKFAGSTTPFCFLVHYTDEIDSLCYDLYLEYLSLYSSDPTLPHIDPVTRERSPVYQSTIDWNVIPYIFWKYDGENTAEHFTNTIEYDEAGSIVRIAGLDAIPSRPERSDLPAPLLRYIPDLPVSAPVSPAKASPAPVPQKDSRPTVHPDAGVSTNQPVSASSDTPVPPDIPPDCQKVYEAICSGVTVPDLIIEALGMDDRAVLSAMSKLEILGFTCRAPGGRMIPRQD